MHRSGLTFAWIVIGWYLMLPPAIQRDGIPWPDGTAPISQWTIAESFDKARACEAEFEKHRKEFQQTYRKVNHAPAGAQFWARFYLAAAGDASCIETDNPRLKEESPAKSSGLQNSQVDWEPGSPRMSLRPRSPSGRVQ